MLGLAPIPDSCPQRQVVVASVAVVGAVLLGGALAGCSSSSTAQDAPATPDRLRGLERARLTALVDGDVAAARRLTAADFQLVNPAGQASDRDEYLGAVGSGAIDYLTLAPASPIAVRVDGASAALRYQADFDLEVGGTRVTHAGWVTVLYERRDDRWRVVWDQATAVPNDGELFARSLQPTG